MFYKEWKYLAAHYVLKTLKKQSIIFYNDDRNPRPPTYQWTDVYLIKKKLRFCFSKGIINDAARMMFIEYKHTDNKVDMLNNSNDIFKTEFKILDKGLVTYKDGRYFRLFLKSWKTIIALFVGTILTIIAVITGLQKIGLLKGCQLI